MNTLNPLETLIPAPKHAIVSGSLFYAATLTLDGDGDFLPQMRSLRDEILSSFGETVLSPQSSAEEFEYFEKQTHDETPLWGANFRREAAPTVSVRLRWADADTWQNRLTAASFAVPSQNGAYLLEISPGGIEMLIFRSSPAEAAEAMAATAPVVSAPAAIPVTAATAAEAAAAACATLMQLLYLGWDGWRFRLPSCRILDWPELSWRGLMVDSARHFMSLAELKKTLSMAWLYKLNRFHWHLTDDQGWRLELLTLPEATGSGSTRPGGDPNRNGFYTQEDVRDLVAYAADRGITVVPELDLPGHVQAVLAGHPEFACTPGPHQVRTEWGISEDVLCMGNPAGLAFTLKAWDEVCELFPGPYVHIGGDEVPTTRWEQCPKCAAKKAELGLKDWIDLHGHFVAAVADHLAKKGKIVFGWDEVLDSSLPNKAHVVHWRTWLTEQSLKALAQGRLLIRSPFFPYYLDFVQTDDRSQTPGLAYRSPDAASLRRVYEYDPFADLGTSAPSGFLGIQANAWSEYIRDGRRLEFMLFPRLIAIAETAWNGKQRAAYETFTRRLEAGHTGRRGILVQRNINYCPYYE
ncbi:beta-N-acetylhexosaminidase [Gracilinema caldarium]|uniref:beta-N-acetylhexosaminidase n=1 Tax=Gracilinema caldarium TaxID=215591 RepID=UPI0026F291DC|nr:family 20 glycosylhydrolase [Gracilinema caldarium]